MQKLIMPLTFNIFDDRKYGHTNFCFYFFVFCTVYSIQCIVYSVYTYTHTDGDKINKT